MECRGEASEGENNFKFINHKIKLLRKYFLKTIKSNTFILSKCIIQKNIIGPRDRLKTDLCPKNKDIFFLWSEKSIERFFYFALKYTNICYFSFLRNNFICEVF